MFSRAGVAVILFTVLLSTGFVVSSSPSSPGLIQDLLTACTREPLCSFIARADENVRTAILLPPKRPSWLSDVLDEAAIAFERTYSNVSADTLRHSVAMMYAMLATRHAHPQGLRCPHALERAIFTAPDEMKCICPTGKVCDKTNNNNNNDKTTTTTMASQAIPFISADDAVPPIAVASFWVTMSLAILSLVLVYGSILFTGYFCCSS